MSNKSLLILICLSISALGLSAQQLPQFTQYMLNDFITNPAAAGSNDHGEAKLMYRKQWAGGFDGDEPTTIVASVHTDLAQYPRVGIGATIFNDVTGPSKRTGALLAYSYHIPLDAGATFSIGLAGQFAQHSLDWMQLTTTDPNDPSIEGNSDSKFGGDANFGAYVYDKEYFLGFTVAQLLESQFNFGPSPAFGNLSNARHFYVMGGYTYEVNEQIDVEPSVLIKYLPSIPIQFDLNARLIYEDRYWAGLNYRTYDAFGILAGLTFNDDFHVGYSYDLTTSELKSVSGGSHEILLGYDFGKDKVTESPISY